MDSNLLIYVHMHINGKYYQHSKARNLKEIRPGSIFQPFQNETHTQNLKIISRKLKTIGENLNYAIYDIHCEDLGFIYDALNGPPKPTGYDKQLGVINKIIYG